MVKLTFIGSGSAFTTDNYQSNVLLENTNYPETKLLVDCGGDARFAIRDIGLSYLDIDSIYISHPHADHIGGLEWVAFSRKFDTRCKKPTLYISKSLKKEIWLNSLSAGLSSLQGEFCDLSTFFNVCPIRTNGSFTWADIKFQIVQTIHVVNGFELMPSFGLMFELCGKKIYYTSDTQFCPNQLHDFYKMADIIYHDTETAPFFSGVHAHYKELVTLPPEIKGKMWLYHYQMGTLPDAAADGFMGFVKKGQSFEFDY